MLADLPRTWKNVRREELEAAERKIQAREYPRAYYRRNKWRWASYRLKHALGGDPDTPLLRDSYVFSRLNPSMASSQLDPSELMMLREEGHEPIS